MKRDIIKVVEGVSNQEELLSSGWRFVSCDEVKEGARLREEVIQLLSDTQVAAPVGSKYKLEDGKLFQNEDYNVVDVAAHDNTESEIEFALMTKHTAVKLKIFRAKDLNESDSFGSCNPFVVIWLINRHCRIPHGYVRADYNSLTKRENEEFIVFQRETTVKMNTVNPEWNEEFYIYICPSDEILLLDVFDLNTGRKNKCLGRAVAEGLCETDSARMEQSWENPFEFELSSIVGTISYQDKSGKLFVGYNQVANYSEGTNNANDATEMTDLIPQSSSNDADSGIYEPALDNDETCQSPDNDETPDTASGQHHNLPHNDEIPQSVDNDEILQSSENNATPQTLANLATLQSHDNNEALQSLENNETSGNNVNLDSSYYSWQNIMQRFKNLPFNETNSRRIQREITEFYRRSMRNAGEVEQLELAPGAVGGTEIDVPGAVGGTGIGAPSAVGGTGINVPGAVGGTEIGVPGAVGGTESCAPKAKTGASNKITSSQNLKAKYEKFINQQKDLAAFDLSSNEKLVIKTEKSFFEDSFEVISRIPQNRIHLLKAPIKFGFVTWNEDHRPAPPTAQDLDSWARGSGQCPRPQPWTSHFAPNIPKYSPFRECNRPRQPTERVCWRDDTNQWIRLMFSEMFNHSPIVKKALSGSITSSRYAGSYDKAPYHGLFIKSAKDANTFQFNPKSGEQCSLEVSPNNSNHLKQFKFIGQVVAMAIFHQEFLDGSFILPIYKMMLGKPLTVSDMKSVDRELYASLQWVRDNDPEIAQLKFTVRDEESSGETVEKDLIPKGSEVSVTEENKHEYIEKIIQWKYTSKIKEQMEHFMEGFNDVIPLNEIKIFDEEELTLLISGTKDISVEYLRNNTEYDGYNCKSIVIQWFWDMMSSLNKKMKSRFLLAVFGTKKLRLFGIQELYTYPEYGFQKFTIRKWGTNDDLPHATHGEPIPRLDLPPYNITSYHMNEQFMKAMTHWKACNYNPGPRNGYKCEGSEACCRGRV